MNGALQQGPADGESTAAPLVVCLRDLSPLAMQALHACLAGYGLEVVTVAEGEPLTGSHFGEPEAGLVADRLYVRGDTPVHSALHEACHFVCMDPVRRGALHTDAGGDYDEENAVCYLSILLANAIPGFGSKRMMRDMDRWGYTFRLGSARAWFSRDADDAQAWLRGHGIVAGDDTVVPGVLRSA